MFRAHWLNHFSSCQDQEIKIHDERREKKRDRIGLALLSLHVPAPRLGPPVSAVVPLRMFFFGSSDAYLVLRSSAFSVDFRLYWPVQEILHTKDKFLLLK